MATEFDFEVQQLDAIQLENQNISSTKIRNAITSGDFKSANDMLGYHYPLSGKVIHGKKIGEPLAILPLISVLIILNYYLKKGLIL